MDKVELNVQHQNYNEDLGIDNFVDEPNIAIVKTLLVQYQPQYLDILQLYVVLLGILHWCSCSCGAIWRCQ